MTKTLQQQRFKRRLFYHHLGLALASSILLFVFYMAVQSEDNRFRWSMATAYAGLFLIGATLLMGPLNVLRNKNNPVSTDLRRDTGIWSGIISIAHVVIGIQVHMGNIWLYFFREVEETKEMVLRSDLFGFANYTGLLATFILLLLLALSNDLSLRMLKRAKWKSLQRWNYGLFAMVFVHGLMYQIIEERKIPFVVLFGVMIVIVVGIQLVGYWHRKHRNI